MTKHILTATLLLLLATVAAAQEFSLHWISSTQPDSTSQLWFRKQIVKSGHPKKAYICIATTGYAELYVNGRNVSRNVMTPYREAFTSHTVTATYDVTRFTHSDTITLAVWYSPSYPHLTDKQISAVFYGTCSDGTPFSYFSDRSWLCRQAPASFNTKGGETIDGRQDKTLWKSNSDYSPALWTGCESVATSDSDWKRQTEQTVSTIGEVINYRYFDIEKDTITYDFDKGLHGWLRITLRNAKHGGRIFFGNMEYICNGKLDEQACMRFTTEYIRKPVVYGDRRFKPGHITNVEGISIVTRHPTGWQPYY